VFLSSLLSQSKGTPLHLIFITDEPSKSVITSVALQAIGKGLVEDLLFIKSARDFRRFPSRLRIEFVRLATMAERHRVEIDHMKRLFSVFYPEGFMHEVEGRLLFPNRKYENVRKWNTNRCGDWRVNIVVSPRADLKNINS
jgi:hypothetical protein